MEPSDDNRRDEINHYRIQVDQDSDRRTGRPTGRPVLSHVMINITRDSEPDAAYYVAWQMDPTATRDLDISFYDNHQLKRSIQIRGAYLVNYTQESSAPGTIDETLVLSPQSVVMDGVEYTREDYL